MTSFAFAYLTFGLFAIFGTNYHFEVRCKTFTRCELVQELIKHGFHSSSLPNWVCLIEAESGGQTNLTSKPNWDGSHDYGLFQINNKYWCASRSRPGMGCNMRCIDMLSSDISMAVECALIIYKENGYGAWNGWLAQCKGKPLPQLDICLNVLGPEAPEVPTLPIDQI